MRKHYCFLSLFKTDTKAFSGRASLYLVFRLLPLVHLIRTVWRWRCVFQENNKQSTVPHTRRLFRATTLSATYESQADFFLLTTRRRKQQYVLKDNFKTIILSWLFASLTKHCCFEYLHVRNRPYRKRYKCCISLKHLQSRVSSLWHSCIVNAVLYLGN